MLFHNNQAIASFFENMRQIYLLLLPIIFISACGSSIQVVSEYPEKTDFSDFTTYQFIDPERIPSSNFTFNAYQQGIIYDAIAEELKKRNYAESYDNDLMVKVQGNIAYGHEESDYSYNNHPYGMRGWNYNQYPRNSSERNLTIIIDLVDVRKNELVWHGEAIQKLRRKDNEIELKLIEAVNAVFDKFIYQAGKATAEEEKGG